MEDNQTKIIQSNRGVNPLILFVFAAIIFIGWMFWLSNEKQMTSSSQSPRQTKTIQPTNAAGGKR
jgi:hypothetical protein